MYDEWVVKHPPRCGGEKDILFIYFLRGHECICIRLSHKDKDREQIRLATNPKSLSNGFTYSVTHQINARLKFGPGGEAHYPFVSHTVVHVKLALLLVVHVELRGVWAPPTEKGTVTCHTDARTCICFFLAFALGSSRETAVFLF